jgi:hypothetical protein
MRTVPAVVPAILSQRDSGPVAKESSRVSKAKTSE